MNTQRLLELADLLETAAQSYEPGDYAQEEYFHDCGAPACALGHWAAAHPERWYEKYSGLPRLIGAALTGTPGEDAAVEFGLELGDVNILFGVFGCGQATTADAAARYIRMFVKKRSAPP